MRLIGDPEIGTTMKGLEECVEEFVTPFSAGAMKELLLKRLADARDKMEDEPKHLLLTLVLEQMKRPTFQSHDAPKVCARSHLRACVRACMHACNYADLCAWCRYRRSAPAVVA